MTNPVEELQNERLYQVWDSSATPQAKERIHEIIFEGEIIEVTFNYNKPTLLPFEKAIKFRQDGFIVKDPAGFQVEGPNKKNDSVTDKLEKNEVIARLDELSLDALIVRAVMRPGGEKYSKSTSKKELIDFLLADKGPKTAPRRAPVPEYDGNEVASDDELSEDELLQMLPGNEPDSEEEVEIPYEPE